MADDKGRIPVFRKKLKAFLSEEDGRIAKQSMLIAGGLLSAAAFGSIAAKFARAGDYSLDTTCQHAGDDDSPCVMFSHGNSAEYVYDENGAHVMKVQHNHHYNHGSHASHASHGSHSSGGTT